MAEEEVSSVRMERVVQVVRKMLFFELRRVGLGRGMLRVRIA